MAIVFGSHGISRTVVGYRLSRQGERRLLHEAAIAVVRPAPKSPTRYDTGRARCAAWHKPGGEADWSTGMGFDVAAARAQGGQAQR
jgi:hypothetical protein